MRSNQQTIGIGRSGWPESGPGQHSDNLATKAQETATLVALIDELIVPRLVDMFIAKVMPVIVGQIIVIGKPIGKHK